jgi:hypothetical protein
MLNVHAQEIPELGQRMGAMRILAGYPLRLAFA